MLPGFPGPAFVSPHVISGSLLWLKAGSDAQKNMMAYFVYKVSFNEHVSMLFKCAEPCSASAFRGVHFLPSAQGGFKQEDGELVKFRA